MTTTVLDKRFLDGLRNPIPRIRTHRSFVRYLSHGVRTMLNQQATLVYHGRCREDSNCDTSCFLYYTFEDKHILIHIFEGTCTACFCHRKTSNNEFRDAIDQAVAHAYVTTSRAELKRYFAKQLEDVPSAYAEMEDFPDEWVFRPTNRHAQMQCYDEMAACDN